MLKYSLKSKVLQRKDDAEEFILNIYNFDYKMMKINRRELKK